MAITGGVDLLNDIFMHMCFAKTGVLSKSGDAKPFSEDADGTVLGEGLGMVTLKRLEDAEHDGDRIYAVIRGAGSSSDGKSQSIYAPSAKGQEKALKKAYETAGVGPGDISLAEVHDATSFGELHQAENLGFCPRGEGGIFAEQGHSALGGRLPVNPSGGLESKGHPVGATGAAQIVELVWQLRGEATGRQVENARIALAENGGGNIGIEEAAMDLGARPSQVFWLVTLPMIAQSLMSAWLLTFTISLDDVVISAFLSGPGATTMPLVIFSRARLGLNERR